MSFNLLQFPPQTGARSMRVPVRWVGLDANVGGSGFLGAWLGDENHSDQPSRRFNWGAIADWRFRL